MKKLFVYTFTVLMLTGFGMTFSGCGNYTGKFHKENWGPRKGKKPKKGKNYTGQIIILEKALEA
ncbi:hypothetical protein RCC89_18470 [Cytophagaceae bacterium ABcell3]|nr:hypothetical protein RCC89_18470 [Cytophagaceae bacterium ABcell3]